MHRLSYIVSWSEDKSLTTFRWCPVFIVKTQIPEHPATRYHHMVIPVLSQLLDNIGHRFPALSSEVPTDISSEDNHYQIKMSQNIYVIHRPISNKIPSVFWIRTAIKEAYKYSPIWSAMLEISTHEVRAVSTSLSFWQNASIRDVMNAASWRSRTTFVSCYQGELSLKTLTSTPLFCV